MKTKQKVFPLDTRLIDFATLNVKMAVSISNFYSTKYLSEQLLRSGTAPALNYAEAQDAESAADFIHKMKICLKELRETFCCLKIIKRVVETDKEKMTTLLKENDELIAIFVASINTARKSRK